MLESTGELVSHISDVLESLRLVGALSTIVETIIGK